MDHATQTGKKPWQSNHSTILYIWIPGRLRKVRRNVYQSNSVPGCGIRWEWYNDIVWVAYDIPTSEVIEQAYKSNMPTLDLSHTPVAIPNYVCFRGHIIKQVNKHTHFEREVKRLTHQKYPKDTLALKTTGASTNSRGNTLTSMNGRSASKHTTPSKSTVSSTRQSVKTSGTVKRMKKMKVEDSQGKEISLCYNFYFFTWFLWLLPPRFLWSWG